MRTVFRTLAIAMMAAMLTTISSAAGAQDATPPAPATITCADVAATPSAGHGPMHGSTPAGHVGHGMAMAEFDLMYIDMMIPHHESIIALAEVALPELTDPRLIEMLDGVSEVLRVTEPYKLASRAFKPEGTVITVGDVRIGGDEVIVMAGPCSAESEEQVNATAAGRRALTRTPSAVSSRSRPSATSCSSASWPPSR